MNKILRILYAIFIIFVIGFAITCIVLGEYVNATLAILVLSIQLNAHSIRDNYRRLENLKELGNKILNFDNNSTNQNIVDFDFKIHHYIFKVSKNTHLARLLERLLCHYLRFWLSIPRQIDIKSFFVEVSELIQAIENKDETLVKECTTAHIRKSVAEIMGTA